MHTAITFPGLGISVDPSPVAFTIGSKAIYWYGVIIALGFLLAYLLMLKKAPDFGLSGDDVLDMLLWAVPIGVVREQLREQEPPAGALVCDYDFFKVLYHAEARMIARSGDAVHIGLLSVLGEGGKELPKRSLDRAMENLQEQIRLNLRRGDIASRCSVSQFILMLPQANYENSCMVCERVIKAFYRQYPHSPAELHYSVQPLEPNT